uniref:Uncharacterized protein n=1 Tax=viral metagenome TaxID=1070528 RepID=A0A6C0M1F9_9ZZZZ
MSLSPQFSCFDAESKLSIRINAFNGNTTNFNRCPRPAPKSIIPIQPRQELPLPLPRISSGLIRPM